MISDWSLNMHRKLDRIEAGVMILLIIKRHFFQVFTQGEIGSYLPAPYRELLQNV